ncbi:hypothetical protein CEXT_336791 [Caerostris extrusa]|uniref:Uncharacterized protein n=1 Tax=Caerostris extrusa TaxID=172846 RepID=A0AAV4XPN9_CAEEX|nr:hypothetical protein CEXT_336791 [Caerostris extrusa]
MYHIDEPPQCKIFIAIVYFLEVYPINTETAPIKNFSNHLIYSKFKIYCVSCILSSVKTSKINGRKHEISGEREGVFKRDFEARKPKGQPQISTDCYRFPIHCAVTGIEDSFYYVSSFNIG